MPYELMEYSYRKLVPMTHAEFLNEPADVVYLTLVIEKKMQDQQKRQAKWQ